jgi:hypothetical protein
MNNININAALDFTLEHDDILIYIMFNNKDNIASKALKFKVLKRYDKESPVLKNITNTSDIYDALKQFGFSEEEIESFMLLKKYGIADPDSIKFQLKFTEYKQIISDIQDKIKNSILTNGWLQISEQDKLLLNSKPPETISYSEYKVQPLNIQNLYAYEPDSNSDNCNLKFVLSILSKYSMYLKKDNSWPDIQSYSAAYIEITNNDTDVTIIPTFYFTDEGIRLYFQTIAGMKNTDTVLQTNKIPADMLDIKDIHTGKPTSFFKDLFESIHTSEYMDHITTNKLSYYLKLNDVVTIRYKLKLKENIKTKISKILKRVVNEYEINDVRRYKLSEKEKELINMPDIKWSDKIEPNYICVGKTFKQNDKYLDELCEEVPNLISEETMCKILTAIINIL